MHSHLIFLDSVKAILVHCAHRLLSESTLILCTGTRPVEGKRPYDFPGIAKFPLSCSPAVVFASSLSSFDVPSICFTRCGKLNTALRSRGHQSVNGSRFAAHKREKPPAGLIRTEA